MDSKREVEKLLKAACEAFIMAVTKAAVEAMLSFLTKVTAVRVARPGAGSQAKPLREQVPIAMPCTAAGSCMHLVCQAAASKHWPARRAYVEGGLAARMAAPLEPGAVAGSDTCARPGVDGRRWPCRRSLPPSGWRRWSAECVLH